MVLLQISVRVRSFNPDFDSLVLIDDLSYRATLCSDALSVFDLGEHFLSTPMLSLLLSRNVNSAKVGIIPFVHETFHGQAGDGN